MGLDPKQKKVLDDLLTKKFEEKLIRFKRPEGLDRHFAAIHTIPEKDRRMYSGIQSLLTSFGQSFYEDMAVSIASVNSDKVERFWRSNQLVSKDRVAKINDIVNNLANKISTPNRVREIKDILEVPNKNPTRVDNGMIVDVYVQQGNKEYYFEIKTVGPNIRGFRSHKEQVLTWVARADKEIHAALVLPYNPYLPKPYKRPGSEIMDLGEDLLVGKDFWDILGGKGCYEDIEDAFQRIGGKYWKKLSSKF
ncbi:MAG: TdeIII family type II restriction endonuclease [Candidatus Nitrosopelagicus sp.]|nr:TdeIII family type II restriction endonuclease [Candidatus Nitrosopelagicus sp.]